jgi:hypothetical protein
MGFGVVHVVLPCVYGSCRSHGYSHIYFQMFLTTLASDSSRNTVKIWVSTRISKVMFDYLFIEYHMY